MMCENKQFIRNKLRNLRFRLLREQQENVTLHETMVKECSCCSNDLADFMDVVSKIIDTIENAEMETEQ